MRMSGHSCYTQLFSNSPFSVLCFKNFKVMKLAGLRYGETNVDIHPFLILNMEKPRFLNGIFLCDINNSLYKLSHRHDNSLYKLLLRNNSVCKICFYSIVNDILKKRKNKSLPQGKEKFECMYSCMMLKLIQIMVYD